ncbi:hypothetical protein GWI33_014421 [Rhynchophorus ferrugineus]|uniref:Uncharacterized protein n=1 Tax=Rhynchophorus ferrugineus TaxID=354439 RepID=A0A834I1P1_RHYFE|nr:hypothetical protein GWI33_014421 [Rhynchophorus ferrugineus]
MVAPSKVASCRKLKINDTTFHKDIVYMHALAFSRAEKQNERGLGFGGVMTSATTASVGRARQPHAPETASDLPKNGRRLNE